MADLGAIGSSSTMGTSGGENVGGGSTPVTAVISGMQLIGGIAYPLSVLVDSGFTAPAYMRILAEGFEKDRASGVSRTPMEDGMVKQLRKSSRVLVTRKLIIQLDSRTDYLNFIAWYRITLDHGAHWFNWTDPEDGLVKLGRFANKLDRETPIIGTGRWRISATIETWDNG